MYRATRQFRLQQCTETLRDHKTAALLLRNGAESITFQSIKHYYCQREVKKCAAQQLAVQAAGASKPVFVEVDTDLYVNALSRANLISTIWLFLGGVFKYCVNALSRANLISTSDRTNLQN